jgi:hypothetical protein
MEIVIKFDILKYHSLIIKAAEFIVLVFYLFLNNRRYYGMLCRSFRNVLVKIRYIHLILRQFWQVLRFYLFSQQLL